MNPILRFIPFLFLAIIVASLPNKTHNQEFSKSFFSSSSSSFSTFSSNGGKPETHTRSIKTEEYYDKDDGKSPEIRKYGENFAKDNDDPALLKKNASTNVESEEMILGGKKSGEVNILDQDEEKKYLRGIHSDTLSPMNDELPPLLVDPERDYGNYSKFLKHKESQLVNKPWK